MPDSNDLTDPIVSSIKTMPDAKKQQWAKMIVTRMMIAWKAPDHKSLAKKLGLNEKAPTNWIQKRSVPWHAVYSCHQATNKSLDWLYNGEEPPRPISEKTYKEVEKASKALLLSGQQMGLIDITKPEGEQFLITGMTNCFLDVVAPKRTPKNTFKGI